MRRRAVVFFLSDFIMPSDQSTEEEILKIFYKEISATKRLQLICAQVYDPHEMKLPQLDLLPLDAESGETIP